jgi:YesN/AraC family two-component response regulator
MYSLVIVDDEMEIRSGLSEFAWEEVGFRAVAAFPDGKEALAFIEARPVDAVLCDVRMPVMDGLELAGRLSERKNPPKIVFLSGHKDFEYLRKAIQYRCSDYLLKPTRFSQLVEVFSA